MMIEGLRDAGHRQTDASEEIQTGGEIEISKDVVTARMTDAEEIMIDAMTGDAEAHQEIVVASGVAEEETNKKTRANTSGAEVEVAKRKAPMTMSQKKKRSQTLGCLES